MAIQTRNQALGPGARMSLGRIGVRGPREKRISRSSGAQEHTLGDKYKMARPTDDCAAASGLPRGVGGFKFSGAAVTAAPAPPLRSRPPPSV